MKNNPERTTELTTSNQHWKIMVFRVEILFNGRKHFVLRRQSEFQMLHRKLKKLLEPPVFPSKRNQLRTKPLEQRRQELEDYIQVILYQNEAVPQELLDFLQLKHFRSINRSCSAHEEQLDASQDQQYSCQLFHQKVVGFSCDPYVFASNSGLPDVVVTGVLQGLFPEDTKVNFRKYSKSNISPAPRHISVPSIIIDRGSLSSVEETEMT